MTMPTLPGRVTLRKATRKNMAYLFTLYQEEIGSSWSEQDFLSFTKSSHNSLYEICLNQRCVGFIQLSQVKPEADLVNIAVAKPLQNMGVGTQALHRLIETLKIHGIEKIFLEVKQTSPAVGFYANSGFTPSGVRKEYYPDGSSALKMERPL